MVQVFDPLLVHMPSSNK